MKLSEKNETSVEKALFCAKANTNSNFAVTIAEMLKKATINFCQYDDL